MAYDAESDRIILFGGYMDTGTKSLILRDTWEFDPSSYTWREMVLDSMPPKGDGAMAYDAESDRIIFFLGAFTETWEYFDLESASETWAYDSNSNTWANMEPAEAPFGIIGTRMVYDSESDRMVLFGGRKPPPSTEVINETWAYGYNTNTWEKMAPAVSPPGCYYHAMAYDTGADRIIIWCGTGTNPVDVSNVWAYDYNTDTWEALESSGAPQERIAGAMVYDAAADQSLLYVDKELWAFDYTANLWTLLSDSPAPGESKYHNMVYSDTHNQITLFGICSELFRTCSNETWILDCSTDTWTDVTLR
jgi:N-acetylneuraminic acid mutarotase